MQTIQRSFFSDLQEAWGVPQPVSVKCRIDEQFKTGKIGKDKKFSFQKKITGIRIREEDCYVKLHLEEISTQQRTLIKIIKWVLSCFFKPCEPFSIKNLEYLPSSVLQSRDFVMEGREIRLIPESDFSDRIEEMQAATQMCPNNEESSYLYSEDVPDFVPYKQRKPIDPEAKKLEQQSLSPFEGECHLMTCFVCETYQIGEDRHYQFGKRLMTVDKKPIIPEPTDHYVPIQMEIRPWSKDMPQLDFLPSTLFKNHRGFVEFYLDGRLIRLNVLGDSGQSNHLGYGWKVYQFEEDRPATVRTAQGIDLSPEAKIYSDGVLKEISKEELEKINSRALKQVNFIGQVQSNASKIRLIVEQKPSEHTLLVDKGMFLDIFKNEYWIRRTTPDSQETPWNQREISFVRVEGLVV